MKNLRYLMTVAIVFMASLQSFGFTDNSVLSTGRWIKVGVTSSGIYEISYSKLREMGFSNPASVAVYGGGGVQSPLNFYDNMDNYLCKDDLVPVSTFHLGDRLFFYGEGVEEISFKKDNTSFGGQFQKDSKNIYSNIGTYFLTDSREAKYMTGRSGMPEEDEFTGAGYGYVYHEIDLEQNNSSSGQLFWGERFNNGNSGMKKWASRFPSLKDGGDARMKCVFYVARSTTGTLSFGVEGAEGNSSNPVRNFTSSVYEHQLPDATDLKLAGEESDVFVSYSSTDNPMGYANLDYWLLTYKKRFPELNGGLSQERVFYPTLDSGKSASFPLSGGNFTIFDVSDPKSPSIILTDIGTVNVEGRAGGVDLIVADLSAPQMQVLTEGPGLGEVVNSNLHGLGMRPEFLIVTIPALRAEAERLAELHRVKDGIDVVVVSTPEIYNEFSGGIPDPMAYRSIVKLLYGDGKLKNLLLFGPIAGDFRGMNVPKDPDDYIIAFQNPMASHNKGANNVNDFYGIVDDNINPNIIEKENIAVGVGILPCLSREEAGKYIDKIERFMNTGRMSEVVNETLTVGGLGDSHIHDNQAITVGSLIHRLDGGNGVQSTLCIDAFGKSAARTRLVDYLEKGKLLSFYFGHGGLAGFGSSSNPFFTKGDLDKLRNDYLGFMVFAGCDLSNTDRGIRGLGESMVLDYDNGMIGTLIATRESWSGQNLDFVQKICNNLYTAHNEKRLSTPTIGEVIARAKTQSIYSNALTYQLLCDPALRLPIALGSINMDSSTSQSASEGTVLHFSGTVTGAQGEELNNFNGDFTVKLMEPEVTLRSQDYETGDNNEGIKIDIRYDDSRVASCTGSVENGKFSGSLVVPAGFSAFSGKQAVVYISAYDPTTRFAVSKKIKMPVLKADESGAERDTEPPFIGTPVYDFETGRLEVLLTDNIRLDVKASSFRMNLDSKRFTGADARITTVSDGLSYNCSFSVLLSPGRYPVEMTLSDVAGNESSRSFELEVRPVAPTIALGLIEDIVGDTASFTVADAPEGSKLYVVDKENKIVYEGDVEGNYHIWTGISSKDSGIIPGLYKAFVRCASEGVNAYSERIDVPVYY